MDPKKQTGPRRVWRMTADAPQGEVLELVPKSGTASVAHSSFFSGALHRFQTTFPGTAEPVAADPAP